MYSIHCTVVLYSCTVQLYCTVVLYSCTVQLYCTVICNEAIQVACMLSTSWKKWFFALFSKIQDGRPNFFFDVHHAVTQTVRLMYNTWGPTCLWTALELRTHTHTNRQNCLLLSTPAQRAGVEKINVWTECGVPDFIRYKGEEWITMRSFLTILYCSKQRRLLPVSEWGSSLSK